MSCYIRMKRSFLQGLLWLYLYGFGFMAFSLEPGFLDFDNLPDTNFSCVGKVIGGYYADLETNCQMFHVCTIGQLDEPMDIRFLCLNGTVFDQETRVCERIDEVDCTKSEQFYNLNLELYGHSQFSNLEENSETEQPLIIKSTLPTTTTTTSTPSPTKKTTHLPFHTSVTPPTITTLENRLSPTGNHHPKGNNHASSTQNLLSAHHFPVINPSATDIRFDPEEINISLHPGAPPDIRTFYSVTNSENQLVATTNRGVFDKPPQNIASSTQKNRYNSATSSDISGFGFTFKDDDSGGYTEPPESFRIRKDFRPSQNYAVSAALQNPQSQLYKSSTFRNDYTLSTLKANGNLPKSSTTLRNYFVQSLKPPKPDQRDQYGTPHTEKNPLPSLPTLTFSSPAPFSLQQRNEQKRYTKDHIPPPRIVISASASVSDASGKRLNYSLGTIGAAQLFKPPPHSYDEYKDEDVALDPFYLDVPKVTKSPRKKRSIQERKNYADIIKNDEEALDLLKFLFDWYKNEKTNKYTTPLSTPLDLDGIASINHELAPEKEDNLDLFFNTSDSFGKNTKYSVFGNEGSILSHEAETKINKVQEKYTITHETDKDYVNDNYEPISYKEYGRRNHEEEINEYKIPEDYVDDNIEPIYYKKREENGLTTTTVPIFENVNTLTTDWIFVTTTEPSRNTEVYYETSDSIPTITENSIITTRKIVTATEQSKIRKNKTKYKKTFSTTPVDVTTTSSFSELSTIELPDEMTIESTTDGSLSMDLKAMIKNIETNTNSVAASGIYKQKSKKEIKTNNDSNADSDIYKLKSIKDTGNNSNSVAASDIYKQKRKKFTETTTMGWSEDSTTSEEDLMRLIEESTTFKENLMGLSEESTTFKDLMGLSEESTTFKEDLSVTTEGYGTTGSNGDDEINTEDVFGTTTDISVGVDERYNEIPTTLEQFTMESTTEVVDSTESTTARKFKRRRGKFGGDRHRFGSDRLKATGPTVEDESIRIGNQKDVATSTEYLRNPTKRKSFPLTDYPLRKSVNPTQAERSVVTKPFSQRPPVFFNCFDKQVNKFYPDRRDCKLFHYCTQGYTENQLLDLKFVCDFNTYFDEQKLICTKAKPMRCS
ncbi:uncharacterized protein LOC130898940 isoform X1 [Diorhabda carinulata]|uniref:uncharacterized protein LOC130898940 isoform X1 n=1 Tax=Diorhabda carinulata TaxID=1163345 RepID=UPI00259FF29A|nr:uncharacterized protein LOC130898940 isoform X1 [Diorhabda carinulata]XP_057664540.1 uncharacterized protein LOC130898940 isoform X1 [Diorhabda carinulata]